MASLRRLILWGFLSSAFAGMAQIDTLSGWVLDGESQEVVPAVHVVNKNSLKGTMTDTEGYFQIRLAPGDTVVFSNIAYKFHYFVYRDSATPLREVIIQMEEQNYLLEEVPVYSYRLTTNKPRAIKLRKPAEPPPEKLRSDATMLAQDLEAGGFIYRLFSSKAQQLARLRELQIEDAYRQRLEISNNRSSVIKLTGLSRDELEAFMFYCKYAPVNMRHLNDYEFLISVQYCFREYVKEKELEGFLQQFD